MKIEILGIAISDIQNGQQFYERQQEGLGDFFLDTLFSDIDALVLYAGIHQQFFGYFRALSKRFPYAIYYKERGESVYVWRVLDCRQKPSRIAKALFKQHHAAEERPSALTEAATLAHRAVGIYTRLRHPDSPEAQQLLAEIESA